MKGIILIEPMLYGDFLVGVYNRKNNLLLDRKYSCPGYASARSAAAELRSRKEWKGFPICYWDNKKEETIILKI